MFYLDYEFSTFSGTHTYCNAMIPTMEPCILPGWESTAIKYITQRIYDNMSDLMFQLLQIFSCLFCLVADFPRSNSDFIAVHSGTHVSLTFLGDMHMITEFRTPSRKSS